MITRMSSAYIYSQHRPANHGPQSTRHHNKLSAMTTSAATRAIPGLQQQVFASATAAARLTATTNGTPRSFRGGSATAAALYQAVKGCYPVPQDHHHRYQQHPLVVYPHRMSATSMTTTSQYGLAGAGATHGLVIHEYGFPWYLGLYGMYQKPYAKYKKKYQKSNKSKTSVRDIKRSNQPDLVTNSIGPTAQEISRLEALCETRTKELNYVKMQLRTGIAGFDAMAVLIKYLTEELDAFSCPRVTEKLNVVTEELQRVVTELGDLKQQKDKLETEIASLTEQYRDQTQKIKNDHQVALSKLEHRLRQEKEQELDRVIEQHSHEVTTLKSYHDKHILEIKNDNKKTLEEQALKQEEDIASLERQHETKFKELQLSHEAALRNTESTLSTQLEQVKADHETQLQVLKSNHSQVLVERDKLHKEELNSVHKKQEMDNEVLQRQHESRLYEITGRLEEIKYTLSGKVESLRLECEELRRKEQQYLDAFQRDSDIKVQIALGPYQNLPAEIESLKCVLDLKNQEVRELRCCKMELEKQLEELPKAREKIRSLEQKIENLEAIIDIKSDYEKQLSEKHIALRRRYDKESKANKRLSMDNETLSWRLSQTDLDSPDVVRRQVSRSPTNSESGSPDPSRRRRSPNHSTSSTDLDRSGSSIMSRSLERSPARKSPPRTNLRRSGTYDLQDVERIDKDLRQTNV